MTVTSVCSSNECTHSTVLYGSTTAVATWGHAQTVKLNLDFFPYRQTSAPTRGSPNPS